MISLVVLSNERIAFSNTVVWIFLLCEEILTLNIGIELTLLF